MKKKLYLCTEISHKYVFIMAIPVTNIPVLTGEVAERFIEQCEYNAQHLRGSEYRGEFEDIYKDIIARSPILQK